MQAKVPSITIERTAIKGTPYISLDVDEKAT
jgi:hypothetical protein